MENQMPKSKPGLAKTGLEELIYKVNSLAMKVQHELKSGHPEKFYQRRLKELCLDEGLKVESEKRVEVWIGDNMVGYLFLDLWIEDALVVECKAFDHALTNSEIGQMLTYLVATATSVGMLYNFGQNSLEFKRILPPKRVQEWQEHLYRCIWTPPGMSLPQIGSEEAGKPIVFSVSARTSVPVRLSVSKSVEESVKKSVEESVEESDYAFAGVNIDAGNRAVALMKAAVKSTYGAEVLGGIGSFGGMYDASALKGMKAPVLVASTDGVGTKVKIAAQAGLYRPVGIDIVNHCINDILVQGAHPLFFLDYFATSKLDPQIVAEVVSGISEACRAAGCALIGGETAEMPGVYATGEFDIAGTIVGVLEREAVLPRTNVGPGDILIGVRSSGPHTNGYSLIRQVFKDVPLETVLPELGIPLVEALLAPHRSYFPLLYPLLPNIKALAHLTGGGFIENIPRILPENVGAVIDRQAWTVPPLFRLIQERGGIAEQEMYRVFNMGIGMVVIVDKQLVDVIQQAIPEETFIIGELVEGSRKVILK
jgi:phosphoribosylformylglycinamidine cyclo-ligase/phosphoribosylamine--glycine ligase/phosphoribosylformylglycinamidine cyclo-ligase